MPSDSRDYIFYDEHTVSMHQEQIILHEVCHVLCEHKGLQLAEREVLNLLFPDLDPEMLQRVMWRSAYSREEEQEAELLASMILERTLEESAPLDVECDPEAEKLRYKMETWLEGKPDRG